MEIIEILLKDSLKTEMSLNLLGYRQKSNQLWKEKPDAKDWDKTLSLLSNISRLESYKVFSRFPDFIDPLPNETPEERSVVGAIRIECQAIAAWLISWRCDWKDPRLFKPEQFESPINLWHEHKQHARLAELVFNMIDEYCDQYNEATNSNAKPGYLWLMFQSAKYRRALNPSKDAVSTRSEYYDARAYREKMSSSPPSDDLPWEVREDCSAILLDDSDPLVMPDRHLENYDHLILEVCRRLAERDRNFKAAFWLPYLSIYRSLYGKYKQDGWKPRIVNPSPTRKSRAKKSKKRR